MKMSVRAMLSAIAVAVLVSGCGGGGSFTIGIDPGYGAWYDVYGRFCGYSPGAGCNFYSDGYKIIDIEDPYFNSYYALSYGTYYYTSSTGVPSVYYGWGWLSPSGIVYNDWGDALNNTDGEGRDHAADVGELQQNVIKGAAEALAAKYDLEPKIAMNMAQALNDYALVGKSRSRTQADYAALSENLYGVNLAEAQGALEAALKGDKSQMETLIGKTANYWGKSPEATKGMLRNFYGKKADLVL